MDAIVKSKRKKLKYQLKCLKKEYKLLEETLEIYILKSQQTAEELLNNADTIDFNDKYETVSGLLDKYRNELIHLRVNLKCLLEDFFNVPSRSQSSDESFHTLQSAYSQVSLNHTQDERKIDGRFVPSSTNGSIPDTGMSSAVGSFQIQPVNDIGNGDLFNSDDDDSLEIKRVSPNTFYRRVVEDLNGLNEVKSPQPHGDSKAVAGNYNGNVFDIKVTHVNNLIDFYVLCAPDTIENLLLSIWRNLDYSKLKRVTEFKNNIWYIAVLPDSYPVRVELLYCNDQTANVRNIDVGNEFQVPLQNLYSFDDFQQLHRVSCAVHCSLYEYESINGWNTLDVVEKFKDTLQDKIAYGIFHNPEPLDNGQFIEIFLDYDESFYNVKDILDRNCTLQNENENGMERNHEDVGRNYKNELHMENSSDTSTPDNCLEWRASIESPYCPEIKDGSVDNFISCFVSYIESPLKFYVHLALKESQATELDKLQNDLKSFYCDLKLKHPVYKNVAVQINSCWCCKNPDEKDDNWYRVRVIAFVDEENSSDTINAQKVGPKKKNCRSMNPEAIILVACVDYGDTLKVKLKDLYPLAKSFLDLPELVVQCSLHGIVPQEEWPKNCILSFENFCGNYKSEMFLEILKISGPGSFIVNLYNSSICSASNYLVDANLAVFLIPDQEINKLENFDPMETHYKSIRNNINLDDNEASYALSGYKPKDEMYICKLYQATGNCRLKRSCPYQHIQSNSAYTMDKAPVIMDMTETLPETGVRLIVQISEIYDPSHFYVTCPFGFEDAAEITNKPREQRNNLLIYLLGDEMNKFYNENSSVFDALLLDLVPGTLVACKFEETGSWYRAKVLDVDQDNKIQVFYIDFGNIETVTQDCVRELQPQFSHWPSRALECYLLNVSPIERENQHIWTEESREFFKSSTEDGRSMLIAKVMKICSKVCYVNLYRMSDKMWINNLLVTKGFAKWHEPLVSDYSSGEEISFMPG